MSSIYNHFKKSPTVPSLLLKVHVWISFAFFLDLLNSYTVLFLLSSEMMFPLYSIFVHTFSSYFIPFCLILFHSTLLHSKLSLNHHLSSFRVFVLLLTCVLIMRSMTHNYGTAYYSSYSALEWYLFSPLDISCYPWWGAPGVLIFLLSSVLN